MLEKWPIIISMLFVAMGNSQDTTTEVTTTITTSTTEDPASFPKTGEVELMVENICHSGHMLHWSSTRNFLAVADIWGQRYIRFKELDPITTTEVTTTTEIPTTTAEPLPYYLNSLMVTSSVVYL